MVKSPISKKELFELIREQIKHEDTLINQRLNWLLLSQAFLFTAFTTIITNGNSITAISSNILNWIPFGISMIGIFVNLSSFVGLRAAYRSLNNLRHTWYEANGEEKAGERIINGFPKITWTGKAVEKAIATATATPLMILAAWSTFAISTSPEKCFTVVFIIILFISSTLFMILSTLRN